jgi:hypothetical protein
MKRSLQATIAVYILTSIHHVYGAIVYHTPWREHIVPIGAVMIIALWLLYKRSQTPLFLTIYLWLSFLMFGLTIGIFEGGYNHLVKDILYFSGMPVDTWRDLFPAPAYEIPNNVLFEATGIAQLLVALIQIHYLRKAKTSKANS